MKPQNGIVEDTMPNSIEHNIVLENRFPNYNKQNDSSSNENKNKSPKIDFIVPLTFNEESPINKDIKRTQNKGSPIVTSSLPPLIYNNSIKQSNFLPNLTFIKNNLNNYIETQTRHNSKERSLALNGYDIEIAKKTTSSSNPLYLTLSLSLSAVALCFLIWFVYFSPRAKKRRRKSRIDPRYKYVIRVKQVQPVSS